MTIQKPFLFKSVMKLHVKIQHSSTQTERILNPGFIIRRPLYWELLTNASNQVEFSFIYFYTDYHSPDFL